MHIRLSPAATAARTLFPRPRQPTPLEQAAAEAMRQLLQPRARPPAPAAQGAAA